MGLTKTRGLLKATDPPPDSVPPNSSTILRVHLSMAGHPPPRCHSRISTLPRSSGMQWSSGEGRARASVV